MTGANPNPPLCTFKMFLDCKPHSFSGIEGAVGLLRWIEKAESAFAMSNCKNEDRVKFVAGTFEGAALTWWNANVQNLGLDAANALPWDDFKMLNLEYCPRGEVQKLETEFWNHKMIGSEGMVLSADPITMQQAVRLAHKLTDSAVAQGLLPPRGAVTKPADNKQKWENTLSKTSTLQPPPQQHKFRSIQAYTPPIPTNQNPGTYAGKHPKCNKCNLLHVLGQCGSIRCQRCGKGGHLAKDCRGELLAKTPQPQQQQQLEAPKGCFESKNGTITDEICFGRQVLKQKSSDVVETSVVVTQSTTTEEPKVLKKKNSVSKSSVLVDTHKEKQKRKPCEVCGLFNHISEECWYRRDSKKKHLKYSSSPKEAKVMKHRNQKSGTDVSEEIRTLTHNQNQLVIMMQQLLGRANLADASVALFQKKKPRSKVKVKSSEKHDSSVASNDTDPSACQKSIWYVDSGGSMHMTGSRSLLNDYFAGRKGFVSFGNYAKENLKYNLLSVSQICDKGHIFLFTKQDCRILSSEVLPLIGKVLDEYTLLKASRVGKVYAFDLSKKIFVKGHPCLFSKASLKESNLWHRRLGHVNFKNMNQLVKHGLVRGLPVKDFSCDENCYACLKGKQHKVSFPPIGDPKSIACLQVLHMDLFGPVRIMSMAKKKYCLVIVDDYSRFVWTFFLHSKDKAAKSIIHFVLYVEKQYSLPVKCVRSDNGTEFRNHILDEFYLSKGIKRQYSIPRTPEQNGVVERKNRTLIEAARTMLADSGLPLTFWAEAVNTACYVQNRVLVNQRLLKTLYEVLHNLTPLISFFRAFGCPCYILNTKDQLQRFDSKVDEGYFVGYSSTCKAYRVFNCRTKVVEETLHVKFNEFPRDPIPQNPVEMFDLDILQYESHHPPAESVIMADDALETVPSTAAKGDPQGSNDDDDDDENTHLFRFSDNLPMSAKPDAPPAPVVPPTTNADEILDSSTSFEIPAELFPESSSTSAATGPPANTCTDLIPYLELKDHPLAQVMGDISAGVSTRSQLSNFCLYALFVSQQEPKNYHVALRDNGWVEAMQLELLQFKKQQVWELVPLPQGKCAIGTKWVFRNKTDENGQIVKNKARLVVQGFSQEEGIDYDETFAPVARLEAIRLFLAYAALHKLKVFQMDVKSAFLYDKIKEEVYVCQPPGFEDNNHPDWVYKLDKALYGLKQAPRAWYDTLSTFLLQNNFTRGSIDKTLFIKKVGQHKLLVQIYVDDIIFASYDPKLCDAFTELMTKNFEMSAMGELQFFLGLQIKQSPDGIFIHRSKYTKDLLKKFDLQNYKPCSNPMSSTTQLDADLKGKSVDETLYRCMIGSLMYLTASRPDIMFATCVCARFQAAPKESHLIVVKRIFRYLQGTQSLGIWYSTGHSCKLVAFSDSDYAGCKLTRKSTSGGCQFLVNCLVSWQSKKQTSVATSTAEAEYIAAASCTSQILWLQTQLLDYGIKETKTPLLMDSASVLCIVKNPVQHSRTKHIEIRHHFIRDCFEKGLIDPKFVPSADELADIFTKPLETSNFQNLVLRLVAEIRAWNRENILAIVTKICNSENFNKGKIVEAMDQMDQGSRKELIKLASKHIKPSTQSHQTTADDIPLKKRRMLRLQEENEDEEDRLPISTVLKPKLNMPESSKALKITPESQRQAVKIKIEEEESQKQHDEKILRMVDKDYPQTSTIIAMKKEAQRLYALRYTYQYRKELIRMWPDPRVKDRIHKRDVPSAYTRKIKKVISAEIMLGSVLDPWEIIGEFKRVYNAGLKVPKLLENKMIKKDWCIENWKDPTGTQQLKKNTTAEDQLMLQDLKIQDLKLITTAEVLVFRCCDVFTLQ
ncbi:hypothetical protein E3N88_00531 [Mikania micrantha]|uniref:Integrase catalytic domain-containing protein n=1 Tax=Mikania micrantha TaxID=192012 RepID=A0A5N6PYE0_9ASTR|nr:hypothetical protein E3N88_00531 [Mikania micrantha]